MGKTVRFKLEDSAGTCRAERGNCFARSVSVSPSIAQFSSAVQLGYAHDSNVFGSYAGVPDNYLQVNLSVDYYTGWDYSSLDMSYYGGSSAGFKGARKDYNRAAFDTSQSVIVASQRKGRLTDFTVGLFRRFASSYSNRKKKSRPGCGIE